MALRHLLVLLSEVVIYKHQCVSADRGWLLSAALTCQLVQIKSICATVCAWN